MSDLAEVFKRDAEVGDIISTKRRLHGRSTEVQKQVLVREDHAHLGGVNGTQHCREVKGAAAIN